MRNDKSGRAGFAAAAATLWLALPPLAAAQHEHGDHADQAEHADHSAHAEQAEHSNHADHSAHENPSPAYEAPPVTETDRAAAFPDLAGMHVEHSMLDDPLNKL